MLQKDIATNVDCVPVTLQYLEQCLAVGKISGKSTAQALHR